MNEHLEHPLTEFIARTCYLAEKYYKEKTLRQGIIEKIISLATQRPDVFGVKIEGIESIVTLRGTVQNFIRSNICAGPEHLPLHLIDSSYFQVHPKQGFQYTSVFKKKLPLLLRKPYFPIFDSAILSLLEIWSHKKLPLLTYLDMLNERDAGLYYLTSDLEIALKSINRVGNSISRDGIKFLNSDDFKKRRYTFENALDAFRDKRKWAKQANFMIQDCNAKCVDDRSEILLSNTKVVDLEKEPIGFFIYKLHDIICKFGRTLFEKRGSEKQKLQECVAKLQSWTMEDNTTKTDTPIQEVIFQFVFHTYKWIRALSVCHDTAFFEQNSIINKPGRKNYGVAIDIRKFSEISEGIEKEYGTLSHENAPFKGWFRKISSLFQNWFILFDASISETGIREGDRFFAFFSKFEQALFSGSFAMSHLHLLDCFAIDPLRYEARAVIGKGNLPINIDGIDISTIMNKAFHQINQCIEDGDTKKHDKPRSLLALPNVKNELDGLKLNLKYNQLEDENLLEFDVIQPLRAFFQYISSY